MSIPVYFVNGFLEAGKTEFINYTIEEDYFQIDGTTLILLCEEGEVEFEQEALANGKAVVEVLDDETDFTLRNLTALAQKHNPERIIIEYNGMWKQKDVLLPKEWHIEEQLTIIDANTFAVYYANMKSQMAEMVRNSDVIVFNRCDGNQELPGYRRSIRAINQHGDIVFEDAYGEMEELGAEDLPYDVEAEEIVLTDDTYATWYLDCMEHLERYRGKTITFRGMAMHQEDFPAPWFIPGRFAMVCCEEDIAFLGFPCHWAQPLPVADQEWIQISAEIREEYWFEYEGEGPVLYATSIKACKPADQVVVNVG